MPGYNDLNIGMDFINNPIMPGQPQQPFQPINSPQQMPSYQINTALSQPDPVITGPKKSLFTVIPDDSGRNTKPLPVPDEMAENARQARRISRTKKEEVAEINPGEIIRSDNAQKELSTMYNYAQTTALLGDTLGQVDMLASELKNEFDNVMGNRTLKNKYMILTNLSESMSQLLNTKTTIIREINNSISKSIDIDYKKEKDRLAAEGAANDDKYMMDLYNAFVNSSPFANGGGTVPLGPSMTNAAVSSFDGSGIIRSPIQNNSAGNNGGPVDVGYLNYLSRITPEQNAMALESDPNIKTVVVYDQSNGNKFFQVMNTATGQVIPNVPVMDNRFLEDTFIDLNNGIAKNNNLHMTYPLVTINSGTDSSISNNY